MLALLTAALSRPAGFRHLRAARATGWTAAGAIFLALGCRGSAAQEAVDVEVWDPPFNDELTRRVTPYAWTGAASSDWTVCVVIPHLKDSYWIAVNYGLAREATLPISVLEDADEIVVTSMTRDVQGLECVDDRALPVGPVTRTVGERFDAVIADTTDP